VVITRTSKKIEAMARNLGLDLDVLYEKKKYCPRSYVAFRHGQKWAQWGGLAEAANHLVTLAELYADKPEKGERDA
tara:strand:- start:211 stop:438 length:228 start_codon:yes stop_codon:yes gene_type:complete